MRFIILLLMAALAGKNLRSTAYFEAVKTSLNAPSTVVATSDDPKIISYEKTKTTKKGTVFTIKTTAVTREHGHIRIVPSDHYSEAARCYVILANVYKLNQLPFTIFFDEARELFCKNNRHLKSDTISSGTELERCETFVKQEMARLYIPSRLVENCHIETLPYNLFLCKMTIPADIKPMLVTNWCTSSCSLSNGWNEYHTSRGINAFPKGWAERKEHTVDVDLDTTYPQYETFAYAKKFDSGLKEEKYLARKKRDGVHGVTPIPNRYVREFLETNKFSPGEWTPQARCLDDEWIFAIDDALPFGLRIFCWSQKRWFGGTRTIGSMNITATTFNCNNMAEYRPPTGSYMIGMSNRIHYNFMEGPDILVAGSYLCSGESKWWVVSERGDPTYNITNGTGQIAECKPGQMICTLELKLFNLDDMNVVTDVRVGCCEAPLEMMYSAIRMVVKGRRTDATDASQNHYKLTYLPEYGKFFDSFWYDFDSNIGDKVNATYDGYYMPKGLSYNDFSKSAESLSFWKSDSDINNRIETARCAKGFIIGLREFFSQYRASQIKCSGGEILPTKNLENYKDWDCPKGHLVCGYIELIKNSTYKAFWEIHLICCPVVHTAKRICGSNGVVLDVVPAEVKCIAVSGAPTECSTTQSYGYVEEEEFSESQKLDKDTTDSYGFSKTNKIATVISSSITIGVKAEASAEVPIKVVKVGGKVKGSISTTFGFSSTDETETTNTKSHTDRTSTSFSFAKAQKRIKSTKDETTTKFEVQDGQRMLFYDVVRRCGKSSITSEDFIRILTPSIKCDAYQTLDHIFSYSTATHSFARPINITFYGYGLEIENDTFTSPKERAVNWALISQGVREKFTDSVLLANEIHSPMYNFKTSPPGLWERASIGIAYNYTFNLVWANNYHFYRVVGRCGRWRVVTNSIWAQATGAPIKLFSKPADPAAPFIQGTDFTFVETDFSMEAM